MLVTIKMAQSACGCMSGTGDRAGTGFPVFECTPGENVLLSQLCDGIAHCGAGDDEVTPLCESKARFRI